jgi:hypothetical protein
MAKQHRKPLELHGALDKFKYEDTTPEIGREFLNVNIVDDLLKVDNADDVLRDLAITSTVFFLVTTGGKRTG